MAETLNEFIEKKVEELVENPEFHFHPSVMHFFRWSLRECADATAEAVDPMHIAHRDYKEAWLGTNDQPHD